jgi:hypothetical protein
MAFIYRHVNIFSVATVIKRGKFRNILHDTIIIIIIIAAAAAAAAATTTTTTTTKQKRE